jgi:hypothetical protein
MNAHFEAVFAQRRVIMLEDQMRQPGPGGDTVALTSAGAEPLTREFTPAYFQGGGLDDAVWERR